MKDQPVHIEDIDDVVTMLDRSRAIGPGVMLPERFVATAGVDGLEVRVDIETTPAGPVARRVAVSDPSGRGVTSEALRGVAVGRIVRAAARKAVWVADDRGVAIRGALTTEIPPSVRAEWPSGDVSTFLRYVASVYRVAQALGDGPTAAVAEASGASRATAGRYVDAARKVGLLPPALGDAPESVLRDDGVWSVSLPANAEQVFWAEQEVNNSPVVRPGGATGTEQRGALDGEHREAP